MELAIMMVLYATGISAAMYLGYSIAATKYNQMLDAQDDYIKHLEERINKET